MRPSLRSRLLAAGVSIAAAAAVVPSALAAQQTDAEALALDSLLEIRISTAAKYAQRIGEVASSVTIVTSEDIERYGFRTIDEVLATIPGFYISNDRNYTYIGARGFSRPTDYNNRLLVLIDGNTVNEAIWGSAPSGSEMAVPMRSLERIEIVRGPGSAMYGTGAIFGVINLITKGSATLDGGEIAAEGGSYGRRGGHLLFGRQFAGGVGLSMSAFWDRSDGQDLFYPEYDAPETHDGVARNLDWERRAAVQGALTRGGLRLHGRYGSRTKAFPTGAYEVEFNAPGAETWDAYAFLELEYERALGAATHLSARTYYNRYVYDGGYPYVSESTGMTEPWLDQGRYQAIGNEATLRWDITSANRLTVGGEVRRHSEAEYAFGEGSTIAPMMGFDSPSTTVSAYLQDEHQLSSAVSFLGGARYDRYSSDVDALSPRLAMIVAPSRSSTIKLMYGQAFRAPSAYEAKVSSYDYLLNPDLRPERARTLEVAWQQRIAAGLLGSVSLFRYRMRDLIDLTIDSASSMYQYRNVGSASSRGLEVGVDARVGRTFSGYANYTLQRTVDEKGMRLTNSPAHLMKAGAGMQTTPWFRPALQLRYESARRTVYDSYTSAYTIADLHLVVTPWRGALRSPSGGDDRVERLELSIRLNNLLDADYATPGGVEHRQPAIEQDGRNLVAELRYRF